MWLESDEKATLQFNAVTCACHGQVLSCSCFSCLTSALEAPIVKHINISNIYPTTSQLLPVVQPMQHQLWQPRNLQGHLTQLTKCESKLGQTAKWLVLKRSQDVPGQCMSMCKSHKSNAASIVAHHVAVTVTVNGEVSHHICRIPASIKMLQEIPRISRSD